MITVRVRDRDIYTIPLWPITTSSVGLPVTFQFDKAWDGLTKIAVFRGSDTDVEVALLIDACVVPPEVLTVAGGDLYIGVYGRDAYGTVVIPTIWGKAGHIYDGAVPEDPDPTDPTPEWSYQVQQAAAEALRIAQGVAEAAEAAEAAAESAAEHCIPAGGRRNQVLTKNSNVDFDASWKDPQGGGGGGYDPIVVPVTISKSDSTYSFVTEPDLSGIPISDYNRVIIKASITDSNGGHLFYPVQVPTEDNNTWFQLVCFETIPLIIVGIDLTVDHTWTNVSWAVREETVLLTNGANSMKSYLNMASHKIINLTAGTSNTDAVNKSQLDNGLASKISIPENANDGDVLTFDDGEWVPGSNSVSGAYIKPSGGIPKTDLASAVQASLGKADTALQTAVTSLNGQTGDVTLQLATDAQVQDAVDDWLDENVAQETGYVLDRTLSMQNAAAPADLLGEMGMSDEMKEALLAHFRNTPTLTGDDTYSALEDALYNNFWQVTSTLSGCTSSNVAKSVKKGVPYSATIMAAPGYTMTGATISVTMGGEDITATAYNNGTITIAEVTGALEIEISAVYNLWAIVNDLTGCDTSNDAETITKGAPYTATISATSGYTMTGATVSITMGGVDITATAYSSGTITISAVTGTVIITITASVSGASLVSISAVYTQSGTVYDTDSLDSLKNDLVVTATYSDSSTAAVLPEDYTLSGTLAAGNCTITVTYQSMTDTFITIVTKYWTKEWTWEDGLPGDNGFTKTASGTSSEDIRDDLECISIYVKGTSAGIGYAYANTYDVGVIEAKFRLNSGQLGGRLSYGDGTNAVSIRFQYSTNYKGIYLEDTSSIGTKLMTAELGVDYTVRIERNGTTGKVFVNGVCLNDDTGLALASLERTETRLLIFGASSSAAYARLMSLKVKDGGV